MAADTKPKAPASPLAAFLDQHHFLFRRLHSLTGIVPIGVFLLAHLTTNSSAVWGGISNHAEGEGPLSKALYYFIKEVIWINTQVPHLILIEVTLWLSIAFHSILGVYYALTGRNNTDRYAYQGNRRYKWQRLTGYLGIIFIFYHVATLRWGWTFLVPGGTKWSYVFSASTLAAALRGSWDGINAWGVLVSLLYFVGVTSLVFHFANGLWTAAITWGITISEQAQRRWGYACAAVGVGLMGMAWGALGRFVFLDPHDALVIEKAIAAERVGEDELRKLLEEYKIPSQEPTGDGTVTLGGS